MSNTLNTPNRFNTAADGTTVVDVNTFLNQPTTMLLDPVQIPYIDNIFTQYPTITTFVFKPGTYKITRVLSITKPGIKLLGLTGQAKDVHITQTAAKDGIAIRRNNVILQDISVQCVISKMVCLTVAGCSNTVVAGCHFYGTNDYFDIYYAGPTGLTEGNSTLDAYNNFNLDTGNVFYNNIVYSSWQGDSVSFSLQYNGKFTKNFIRGGKVAVYMCRSSNIYNNIICDSTTNGFYVSLPSDNTLIIGNKISNVTYSAVKVANQMEHGTFTPYDYNILIKHNTLFDSGTFGIELNDSYAIDIVDNDIVSGQTVGVYALRSMNILVKNNSIAYFNYGVYFTNVSGCKILSNKIISIYPKLGTGGIKLENNIYTISNVINNNTFMGQYKYATTILGDASNTASNNTIQPYYTIDDERRVYNVTSSL